jgi:bacterioferritin
MTLEQRTVDTYNEYARLCATEDDQLTHKLFQDLSHDEEEHVDRFRTERDNMLDYGEQYLALQSIAHSRAITK